MQQSRKRQHGAAFGEPLSPRGELPTPLGELLSGDCPFVEPGYVVISGTIETPKLVIFLAAIMHMDPTLTLAKICLAVLNVPVTVQYACVHFPATLPRLLTYAMTRRDVLSMTYVINLHQTNKGIAERREPPDYSIGPIHPVSQAVGSHAPLPLPLGEDDVFNDWGSLPCMHHLHNSSQTVMLIYTQTVVDEQCRFSPFPYYVIYMKDLALIMGRFDCLNRLDDMYPHVLASGSHHGILKLR
jgi:hypothetical protein